MEQLTTLGGDYASGDGIYGNGQVVVGISKTAAGDDRAVRWTSTGIEDLGTLGYSSSATAASFDGSVVVGFSNDGWNMRAFRWTNNHMTDLGTLGGYSAKAMGVSADGTVVVGQAQNAAGVYQGFRWTSTPTGMQSIEDWLAGNGMPVAAGVKTQSANSASSDGRVVVGQLDNGHAYVARVPGPTPSPGAGLIDVQDYNTTLQAAAFPHAQLTRTSDLALNGLMGTVPHTLLAPTQLRAWTSGDWGQRSRYGDMGQAAAGDFGLAVGITDALEGQLSLGQQYADNATPFAGRTTSKQTYVAPGLSYLFSQSNVVVGVLGYYGEGTLEVDRGYLNAGNAVLSTGRPGTSTTGARLRADWVNAYALGPVAMTPYVSYTWIESKLNGYTEVGGGFPVQWNARSDTAQLLRLGQDAQWQFNEQWKLTGRLEYVQRMQQDNPMVTGRIVGLSGFGFDANQKQNEWARVGLGGEYRLSATSTLSTTLNATTEKADAPDVWLNVAYVWMF